MCHMAVCFIPLTYSSGEIIANQIYFFLHLLKVIIRDLEFRGLMSVGRYLTKPDIVPIIHICVIITRTADPWVW